MLESTNRVRLYSEALTKIQTGRYDNKDTYVHDYDAECYRKDRGYTLNGLHWGYPDSIVETITGEPPDGTSSFLYATWVTAKLKKHPLYGENSRFQIVKFKEIRAIIEKSIKQKLAKAQKDAGVEADLLPAWRKVVEKKFRKYRNATIRIQMVKSDVEFILIKPERLKVRGMGWFLEDIKKGDVSISASAVKAMYEGRPIVPKSFSTVNFWDRRPSIIIGGMFQGFHSLIPLSEIWFDKGVEETLYHSLKAVKD